MGFNQINGICPLYTIVIQGICLVLSCKSCKLLLYASAQVIGLLLLQTNLFFFPEEWQLFSELQQLFSDDAKKATILRRTATFLRSKFLIVLDESSGFHSTYLLPMLRNPLPTPPPNGFLFLRPAPGPPAGLQNTHFFSKPYTNFQ